MVFFVGIRLTAVELIGALIAFCAHTQLRVELVSRQVPLFTNWA